MINKLLDFLGFTINFTEDDNMYKNLKLKDFGLDKYTYLKDDEDLKDIFLYSEDINPDVYKKFESKYFWSKVMRKHKTFLVSYVFSVMFCVFAMVNMCYPTIILVSSSLLITFILKRIVLNNIKTYNMYKIFSKL